MRGQASKRVSLLRILQILVGLPVVIVAGLVIYTAYSMHSAFQGVTNPSRYQAILRDTGYGDSTHSNAQKLAHFPPTVPGLASNVRFFYRPKGFQGGEQTQLRMVLPPNEIAAIKQRFLPLGKDAQNHAGRFRNADNTGFEDLADDFEAFVLDADDSNHGHSYGVAINEKTNEVIYWLFDD